MKTLLAGPHTYNKAYKKPIRLVGSQDPESRCVAKRVFQWLVCAEKSLRTLRLWHALAVQPGATNLDKDDLETTGVMVDACKGPWRGTLRVEKTKRHMSVLTGVVIEVYCRGRHDSTIGLITLIYAQREMDDP